MDHLFLGIDAGGTHTRVMIVDQSAALRAYVEGPGVHPLHPIESQMHVHHAILRALAEAQGQIGRSYTLWPGLRPRWSDHDRLGSSVHKRPWSRMSSDTAQRCRPRSRCSRTSSTGCPRDCR